MDGVYLNLCMKAYLRYFKHIHSEIVYAAKKSGKLQNLLKLLIQHEE